MLTGHISVEMSDKIYEIHVEVHQWLHVKASLLTTTLRQMRTARELLVKSPLQRLGSAKSVMGLCAAWNIPGK
jgi:hypothetical protein